jgi:uncharacterized LabA/DUF88 family protein
MKNITFIDGQNLYLGTAEDNWKIDNKRFRVYLKDKFKVAQAYYFLGCYYEQQKKLYENLRDAGFILVFREHNGESTGKKKGNVDTDIVFEMMKSFIEDDFDKIFLVSGDGDYKKTVDYLIEKNKFGKILFPNRKKVSSLYRKLTTKYCDYLGYREIRRKIEYTQKMKGAS